MTALNRVEHRYELLTPATVALVLWVTGCVSGPLGVERARASSPDAADSTAPVTNPFERGLPDSLTPPPESIIGHEIGDGAVRYDALVRYMRALAEASDFVTLTPYAESHEGRTLYYLTVTSKANHERLDEIKADNGKLDDPRKLSGDAEADRILDSLPGVAWMAYSIHGDELSSTDAAIEVAYQLAAGTDERVTRLRDELVINIDPLMNPDGRARYLGQLQTLTGKVRNVDYQAMQHRGLWSAGRGNHYLFDLNRDWAPQVHPETRGRAREIRAWNPHLVVDSHEMGSLDTYLFDPPREPHNNNLSEANLNWRRRFSKDQARAFDRHGWSYYTKDWYEEWYPGYTNAWTSLRGAIGLLYEQAGVNAAAVKQRAGNVLTYREAVHHHVVSSFANLETLRVNRREILSDFLEDHRWAVSEQSSDQEVFLVAPSEDRRLLRQFETWLGRHGIESQRAAEPFRVRDAVDMLGHHLDIRSFPPDTLIVRAAQPRRRLLRALLEFDPRMTDSFLLEERKELENDRGTKVYDVTAWNLSMGYNLDAFWAKSIPTIAISPPPEPPAPEENGSTELAEAGYGYLIDVDSSDVYRALARLLTDKRKVRAARQTFTTGGRSAEPGRSGRTFRAGTLLLRNNENADDLRESLLDQTRDLDLDVVAVDTALSEDGPDLGSGRFRLLAEPRIGIASQWPISSTSFGSIWHLLDARVGLRVSPVNVQFVGMMDLRRYNVLVIPNSWGSRRLSAIFDKSVRERLRSWLEAGGTLVAVGRSAAFFANEDRELSAVRLRRDVLDELPTYAEALERERSARRVNIDPAIVWDNAEPEEDDAQGASDPEQTKSGKGGGPTDLDSLKRQDAWERIFRPVGAIGAATVDPEHWLCFGVRDDGTPAPALPVLLSGSGVFLAKRPVAAPVRLAEKSELRLSGLMWPEARKRLENSAYATVERVGYGQIILFSNDPFFRGYFEGTGRLLLNALLLGPGMGTSQPAPW
ncbi:MAG: M14 family metallopeptidase [Phycisphaerae bacterium]|jgi:hypothetical protein